MAKVTLSVPDDELAQLTRWASYNDRTLEEMLEEWLGWRSPTIPAGSMSIVCVLPEAELKRWDTEARQTREYVAEWIRRMGNYVIATGVSDGGGVPEGRIALAALIDRCHWCEIELPGRSTIRRQYCSANCRVAAWRARRRRTLQQ